MHRLSTTEDYHRGDLTTLGWEVTVCNALHPANTALRRILREDRSFGYLLYGHLRRFVPVDEIVRVIEIGGGYGYLMKDFLEGNGKLEACMLDISPVLLARQKETLRGYRASFREEDFLKTDPSFLEGFELAVMNENLGDFPTLVDMDKSALTDPPEEADPHVSEVIRLFRAYHLEMPPGDTPFPVNTGAMDALEKLCQAKIPFIYVGEHSCEAEAPLRLQPLLRFDSRGVPERISLKGHDEYTIKFSYLQQIGEALGYRTVRGHFADFIPFDVTEEVSRALATQGRWSDEAEMICHFVEDLYKYEYLILTRR